MATPSDPIVISEKIVSASVGYAALTPSSTAPQTPAPVPVASATKPSADAFESLQGKRYKIKPPTIDAAIYIIIVDKVVDGELRPWELFIETKIPAIKSKFTLAARLASAIFRTGGPVAFVTTEFLDAPMEDGYYERGRYIPSIAHHIGLVLEQHLNGLGFGDAPSKKEDQDASTVGSDRNTTSPFASCPSCGRHTYVMSDGCGTCNQCGYSKCG